MWRGEGLLESQSWRGLRRAAGHVHAGWGVVEWAAGEVERASVGAAVVDAVVVAGRV